MKIRLVKPTVFAWEGGVCRGERGLGYQIAQATGYASDLGDIETRRPRHDVIGRDLRFSRLFDDREDAERLLWRLAESKLLRQGYQVPKERLYRFSKFWEVRIEPWGVENRFQVRIYSGRRTGGNTIEEGQLRRRFTFDTLKEAFEDRDRRVGKKRGQGYYVELVRFSQTSSLRIVGQDEAPAGWASAPDEWENEEPDENTSYIAPQPTLYAQAYRLNYGEPQAPAEPEPEPEEPLPEGRMISFEEES